MPQERRSEMDVRNAKRLSLRLIRETIGHLGRKYIALTAALLLLGCASLLPPYIFQLFTAGTQSIGQANAKHFIDQLLLFGTIVSIALLISTFASTFLHERLRLLVENWLRGKVLRKLHQIPIRALDSAQRGDLLTRMMGDLAQVEQFLTESIPSQVRSVGIFLGAGVLFFHQTGPLALVPLLTALVMGTINLYCQQKLSTPLSELRSLHGGLFQYLIEGLEGMRTVRSHAAEGYFERRFDRRLTEIQSKSLRVVRSLGMLLGANELVGQLLVTLCLTAVAFGLRRGDFTVQQALIYPFYLGIFYGSAQSLIASFYDWNRFLAEGGRLSELLYLEAVGKKLRFPLLDADMTHVRELGLADVRVGHSDAAMIPPVSARIKVGEMWGIVGPSGCGKSTLLEAMAGLRSPLEGYFVCGSSRHSAATEHLPVGLSAYVEQRPYIFEGTLRENLTLGNSNLTNDALLWTALRQVGLFGFATQYGGLDYSLRDAGRNLSEGERYRIALARALLLDRPFLLLDEPFAALDPASIEIVLETLRELSATRAIVIVTHFLPENFVVDGLIRFNSTRVEVETEMSFAGISDPAPGKGGAILTLSNERKTT